MKSQHFDQLPKRFLVFSLINLLAPFARQASSDETHFDITLPGYQPERDEVHVCVNVAVPVSGYITAFSPLTTTERIHHLGLHACSDVQHTLNEPWDCDIYYSCSGQKMLFSWDHVGAFELPNNTGMPIGLDSGLGYVLLRVHYGRKFKGKIVDYSGVRLRISSIRPAYIAGAYAMVADWGNTILYQQTRKRFVMHENPILISPSDILASQCVYDSTGVNHATHTGIHDHNEMCVVFLHYYIKADDEDVTSQFTQCIKNHENVFDKYPTEMSSLEDSKIKEEPAMAAAHNKVTFTIAESSIQLPSYIGRILDLAFDNNGHLIVLHTGAGARKKKALRSHLHDHTIPDTILMKVSPDGGTILDQWGKNIFYSPSGIFIDENDHLWVVDLSLQQVFKFNTSASWMSPVVTLGLRFQSGFDRLHFCDPSAIAVSSGIAFVVDGCGGKSRISKFSSTDGKPLGTWTFDNGLTNSSAEAISRRSSISLDANGQRIFVSNTRSSEVRIFSFDGNFLGRMKLFDANGSISDVSYCSEKNVLFLISRETDDELSRIFAFDATTHAAMYSWTAEEELQDLNHAVAILALDDCSKVFVGDFGSKKLHQFHIYTNMTRRESGDYMQAMEINDKDDYDPNGQDWMTIASALAIGIIPLFCVVAWFYALLRRWRSGRVRGTSLVKPTGRWSKCTSQGYRDYKGFKLLTPKDEMSDSPLLSLDSSDQEDT